MDNRRIKKISQSERQRNKSPLNGAIFSYELLWAILLLSSFMNGLGDADTVVFWRDTGATFIMIACNHFYVHQRVFFKSTVPLYKQKLLFSAHLLFMLGSIYFLLHEHSDIIMAFRLAASSAIFEEYTFRGMIFGCLLDGSSKNSQRLIQSSFITAMLFGMIHLINYFPGGNLSVTILQVIQTTALGFVLCALYLRSGSMILPISLHFMLNFMALLYNHVTTEINLVFLYQSLALTAFYFLAGFFLLRKNQSIQFHLLERMWQTF